MTATVHELERARLALAVQGSCLKELKLWSTSTGELPAVVVM